MYHLTNCLKVLFHVIDYKKKYICTELDTNNVSGNSVLGIQLPQNVVSYLENAINKEIWIFNTGKERVLLTCIQSASYDNDIPSQHVIAVKYEPTSCFIDPYPLNLWEKIVLNPNRATFRGSYIDYVLIELFRRDSLIFNDITHIVQRTGERYFNDIIYRTAFKHNLHDYNSRLISDLNHISNQKYEGAVVNSNLVILDRSSLDGITPMDRTNRQPYLKFDKQELRNHRLTRKLLEVATDKTYLVGTPSFVQGFVLSEKFNQLPDGTVYIELRGSFYWVVSMKIKGVYIKLLQFKSTDFSYPREAYNQTALESRLNQIFDNFYVFKEIGPIVNMAVEQKHGTMVVLSTHAEEEALRLVSSGIKLSHPTLLYELTSSVTSIDGALLCDHMGICYAIGVILDGTSSNEESMDRGARHNSARRYMNHHRYLYNFSNAHVAIIIVSEDGDVTVLPEEPDFELRHLLKNI